MWCALHLEVEGGRREESRNPIQAKGIFVTLGLLCQCNGGGKLVRIWSLHKVTVMETPYIVGCKNGTLTYPTTYRTCMLVVMNM